jgi:hypothetical protein
VIKIYALFNSSQLGEVRKLAGRFIIELLTASIKSQDFFCEMIDIEPVCGSITTINAQLPVLIKQKLSSNPQFLATIH